MATNRQQLWPVQALCLEKAKSKNTIVCLPTNEGKTLIAARLVEHYLQTYRDKRAVFLVPTQALVDQQAEACGEQITLEGSPPRILKMVGDEQAGWEREKWKNASEDYHVFVGTPAVFEKTIVSSNYLSIAEFSVVIFDECHNAKGNHSMARVMRDGIHPYINKSETGLPRILGLTASFANGSTDNLAKDRRDLEGLLNATICCPQAEQKLKQSSYTRVLYNGKDKYHTKHHEAIISRQLDVSLKKMCEFKEVKKTLGRCKHVFSQLGRDALDFYVQQHIVQQIEDKIDILESKQEEQTSKAAQGLRVAIPLLREEVRFLGERLSEILSTEAIVPRVTPKLQRLLDLLVENFEKNDDGNGYRGIIFVEQICVVTAMAKQINDTFAALGAPEIRCAVVAGSSAQKRSDRIEYLNAFRSGEVRILVATSACEEGLDVPQCQFSVMYDEVTTAKSHIQRAGRVRHSSAEIYYFDNDPASEVRRAARVWEVARDTSLALSSEELEKENATICSVDSSSNYPYPNNSGQREGGLVTLLNSKELLVQYCCSVLGESIDPTTVLYDCLLTDGHQQVSLTSVRYPSPGGWQTVEKKEVQDFWEGEDLTKILLQSRTNKKSRFEREERLFAYVIVRKLREEQLLDHHNKPSLKAHSSTKLTCNLPDCSPIEKFAFKQKVTLPQSTAKEKNEHEEGKMATEPGCVITLETSPQILRRYVSAVFEDGDRVFEEELFEHGFESDPSGQRKRQVPMKLRFPIPMGWWATDLGDYFRAFGHMNLDDQLTPGKQWTRLQKVELAFMYLAVSKLHELGYLDDEYRPSLQPAALQSTRKNCTLDKVSGTSSGGSPTSVRTIDIDGMSFGGGTGISSISSASRPNPATNNDGLADNNETHIPSPHQWTSTSNSSRTRNQGARNDNNTDDDMEERDGSIMNDRASNSNRFLDQFADHDEASSLAPHDKMSMSNLSRTQNLEALNTKDDDEHMSCATSKQGSHDNETLSEKREVMSTVGMFDDAEPPSQQEEVSMDAEPSDQPVGPMFSNMDGRFDDCDGDMSL